MARGLESRKSRPPTRAEIEREANDRNVRGPEEFAAALRVQRKILSGALPEHVNDLKVAPNNVNERDPANGDADGRQSRIGRRS